MYFLESIDKRVRGTEAFTHVLGYRPLVVIPYLAIEEDLVRRKSMLLMATIAAIVLIIAALLALHLMYMPLNIIFFNILAKLV